MSSVLLVLQLIVAIFLVAVILMQRSNGGALSGLGGGDIGGLLSARSKGNILTRITAILATLFFVLSLAISIYFSRMEIKQVSVVDNVVNDALSQEAATQNESAATETNTSAETPAKAENEPSVPTEEEPSVPVEEEAPIETDSSVPAEAETPTEAEPSVPTKAEPSAPVEAETPAEPEVPVAE